MANKSIFWGLTLLGAATLTLAGAHAAPRGRKNVTRTTKKAPVRVAALPAKAAPKRLDQSKLPQFVSMNTIRQIQEQYKHEPMPILQPFWEGLALKRERPMRDLLAGPSFDVPATPTSAAKPSGKTADGMRFAQVFPRPIAPAAVPNRNTPPRQLPQWVRYPLEFQLCGIGLGTLAVNKDRYNRIDRYGLFALHGNPTAVVVPIPPAANAGGAGGGEGGAGGAPAAAPASSTGTGGGAPTTTAATTAGATITVNQQPPEVASLFPGSTGGSLPDWAAAITVSLDNNHVEWLYNRGSFSMGFVVDRLGYVDAVVVAGVKSPIAETQMEDPLHSVKLGDDLRKVLFRYGYPDSIDTYGVVASAGPVSAAGGGGGADTGAGGAPGGAPGAAPAAAAPGSTGGGGDAAGGAATGTPPNGAFRTFELRYEQSYNVVFTIRNNRVVRIYIFGDPDFFNAQRRTALRTRY